MKNEKWTMRNAKPQALALQDIRDCIAEPSKTSMRADLLDILALQAAQVRQLEVLIGKVDDRGNSLEDRRQIAQRCRHHRKLQ